VWRAASDGDERPVRDGDPGCVADRDDHEGENQPEHEPAGGEYGSGRVGVGGHREASGADGAKTALRYAIVSPPHRRRKAISTISCARHPEERAGHPEERSDEG